MQKRATLQKMYTVAFVDDETLVRAGLRAALDWKELGFTIAGDYSSADGAIDAIHAHSIDVLFVDIMMPGLDGITLIERLHETYSDIVCVVLTSFGEFSYAQRALRSGARDYLLKSAIDSDRLVELMTTIRDELDRRERPHQKRIVGGGDEDIRRLFGNPPGLHEEDPLVTALAGAVPVRIALAIPDSLPEEIPAGTAASVAALIQPVFESAPLVRIIDSGNRTVFAFVRSNGDTLVNMLEAARRTIRMQANLEAYVIAAQPASDSVDDLVRALWRLQHETTRAFYESESGKPMRIVRSGDFAALQKQASKLDPERIYDRLNERLFGLLSKEASSEFSEELDAFLQASGMAALNPDDFKEMLYALVNNIYRELHSVSPEFPAVPPSTVHRAVREALFADDVRTLLTDLFRSASTEMQDCINRGKAPVVTRAQAFIADNYSRQLSLDEVAMTCSVNPSYLSRVFHQSTGHTFTEYVNRTRVEHAKKLLITRPTALVYEIARELGFEDSAYFSRVFREITGTTPGTWRDAHKNKRDIT